MIPSSPQILTARSVGEVREAITEIPREPAFAAISEETRPEATRILPERSIPPRSACPAIRSIVLCRPISSANRRSRSPSQAPAEWIPPLPRYASDARASASIAEKSDSGVRNGPAEGNWTGRPPAAGTWKLIPAPHPEVKVGVTRSGTSPRIRTDAAPKSSHTLKVRRSPADRTNPCIRRKPATRKCRSCGEAISVARATPLTARATGTSRTG